jgi:branched-chain amino acid transport system permease protein
MQSGVFHTTYAQDMALHQTIWQKWRLRLLLVALVIFPFVANTSQLYLANTIAIAAVGAIGLNILVGFTGQISLGQGAFLAVGAYSSGLFTDRLFELFGGEGGLPFLLSMLLAALFTAVVGTLFGLPSLRLKGLYLAIATLAAQQIIIWVITHTPKLLLAAGAGGRADDSGGDQPVPHAGRPLVRGRARPRHRRRGDGH